MAALHVLKRPRRSIHVRNVQHDLNNRIGFRVAVPTLRPRSLTANSIWHDVPKVRPPIVDFGFAERVTNWLSDWPLLSEPPDKIIGPRIGDWIQRLRAELAKELFQFSTIDALVKALVRTLYRFALREIASE